MKPDPLVALLRLREFTLDEVRRLLRACIVSEAEAEAARTEAEAMIQRERVLAASLDGGDGAVEAFAAWLPRGRAASEAAFNRHCAAQLATTHARAQLATARANVESARAALAHKAELAALEAERRAQAALDEIGQRRRTEP